MKNEKAKIHELVIDKYSGVAKGEKGGCSSSCCDGANSFISIKELGKVLDYGDDDLLLAPGEANLGLGCGNPIGEAGLKQGEVVLDLGSGAGFDAFLAAKQVGGTGKVIGVDMTPEMVQKARANAEKMNISNVDFRLGEIEKLPVRDGAVDVIISNCVINLSPQKDRVFREAFRVLKPRGRMLISDIVTQGELPKEIREDPEMWSACIAGALDEKDYLQKIRNAGFEKVEVVGKTKFMEKVSSIKVRAHKPTN